MFKIYHNSFCHGQSGKMVVEEMLLWLNHQSGHDADTMTPNKDMGKIGDYFVNLGTVFVAHDWRSLINVKQFRVMLCQIN